MLLHSGGRGGTGVEPRQPTGMLPGTSFSTITVNRHMKSPQTTKGMITI